MIVRDPARTAPARTLPLTGITIFGCNRAEADLFRALGPRFGVAPRICAPAPTEANVDLARGTRCVSVGHQSPVSHATLLALSRAGVEYVSTRSIGYDHIDVSFAERIGISVGTVAYSPDSVADYTLMLMLMAVRHAAATIRGTDGQDFRPGDVRGRELRDLTVGVIGTGRIGTAVMDRLRGFGCRVVAYDRRRTTGAEYVSLDSLLRQSDIVTLHVPLTAETRYLLDRQRIDRLKPGAFVVNTGRGALLDTEALCAALERGALGGAALDVLEGETGIFAADCRTSAVDHPQLARLQRLPNVVISPHIAYDTDHALADIVRNTLINCLDYERGTVR